jgi:LemA protein
MLSARNTALGADSIQSRAHAEQQVASGVHQLIALAEAYPDLKASDHFLELQRQLADTEKLIAHARQYYNACVRDYNTLIEAFPSNIVASSLSFRPADFFEIDEMGQREAPAVRGLP